MKVTIPHNYLKKLSVPLQHKVLFSFLLFMIFSVAVFAQNNKIKVTGVVKDASNQTLIGVSVKLNDGKSGTVTDINGKYEIAVPDQKAVLTFSYIGYITQQQVVGVNKVINIILGEKSSGLNEVVVIGYGVAKKKDLTGSVAKVDMEDLTKAPVMSIDQALAGRMAGVQVSSADGQPGSAVSITVRGPNSITQDNSPLYVVDGFPVEGFNLNTFNPQDIESIDVLKDASSTAIYGARGANGVIIITT